MLTPLLDVTDLRDKPDILRVTDKTVGYGEGGNAGRLQIARAELLIERWAPQKPYPVVAVADLPITFITKHDPVDIRYPEGNSPKGDGLLLFTLSLYGRVGAPVQKSTYTARFPAINTLTHRLLIERNDVLGSVMIENGATVYSEEATSDVLDQWRVESLVGNTELLSGRFEKSATFTSALTNSPSASTSVKLLATRTQAVILLGRNRKRLNQLSEKLIFDGCASTPQLIADGLVWLRLYEQLAELEIGNYGNASPYRIDITLRDFTKTLDNLWLRHG